jgi:uncharacterized delta-60 repeat protein
MGVSSKNDSNMVNPPSLAATANYKSDLNITWGYTGFEGGEDIVLDDSGNIYITGRKANAGRDDVFIVKYNSTGIQQWNNTWGRLDKTDAGWGIALDGSGNIYITGYTESLGAGGYDAFIAIFDNSGNSLHNITWGDDKNDEGYDIARDGTGNIYITGYTNSFGAGGRDAFIAKYDSTYIQQWNTTWGGNLDDQGYGIALDGSGNIYMMGYTNSFGAGGDDAFIAKFDNSGNSLLNITWGGSNGDQGFGIALDGSGNIYITGYTDSVGAGDDQAFIAKFDNSGNSLLNITWGGDDSDDGYDIAIDGSGNIYITGYTESFGAGDYDAFIAKFNSAGNSLNNITWGDTDDDQGNSITLDESGNIYITGYTESFGAGNDDAFIAKYTLVPVQKIVSTDDDDDDDDDKTETISGYNLIFLIGFLGFFSTILIIKRLK